VSRGAGLIILIFLTGVIGCSVNVAELKIATPKALSADSARTATSRGWHEGESCRFWLLVIPFGLPQVDEAMNNAMQPVNGVYMSNVTVFSVHPVYVVCGWHCYRVRGEVFG